jgi:hypothetical protein
VWWAARALKGELWGFRFDFPLQAVPEAGSRDSLHYYVYSDRLFFEVMEPNDRGIPVQRSRTFGVAYNPAYVAWYGLMRLERALRGLDPAGHHAFETQVEWLVENAVWREDGAAVWPYTVDWQEGACGLRAPWICAMAQGLAMSVLVRAHRLTGQRHLLTLGHAATRVFEKDIEEGGVRTLEAGRVLYEEYPGYPLPRVLDGFLFSLLGLYDLAAEMDDPAVRALFADGLDGLVHTLPFWDYRGKWSWYGSHGFLCPPHYNRLNGALLGALGRLTGQPALQRYAERWNPGRLTGPGRAEVFLAFVLTKNWSRVKKYLGRRRGAVGVTRNG